MVKSTTHPRLHYEAPDVSLIGIDVSSPLLQSITLQEINEETMDW